MRIVTWKAWDEASAEIGRIATQMKELQQLSLNAQEAIIEAALDGYEAHAIAAGKVTLTNLQEEYLRLSAEYQIVVERVFGERPRFLEPAAAFFDRINTMGAHQLLALMRKNGLQLEKVRR